MDAFSLGNGERLLGSERDGLALPLPDRGDDGRDQLAGRCRSVEVEVEGDQPPGLARCQLDQSSEVHQARRKSVELRHDEHVSLATIEQRQRLGDSRSLNVLAGLASVLDERDRPAAALGLSKDRRSLSRDPVLLARGRD